MSYIELKAVSKKYGAKKVLDQVDLTIEAGQIYGLIGPSGAGKTTVVKCIVGMERADEGEVTIHGVKMPSLEMLQQIGYMAQSDALYSELTGRENLQFFASLFQVNGAKQRERIAYVADLVKLGEALDRRVDGYSGGMKRRLSLAIALVQNPPLLLLDEPTVGIDPGLREAVWTELHRLCESEGKTIVVTTHVMDEAERCAALSMIRDGRVLASGSPEALKQSYGVSKLDHVFMKAGEQRAQGVATR